MRKKGNRCTALSKKILIGILFFFLSGQNSVFSQISLDSYAEVGSNAVSQGIYGGFSAQVSGQFGSFNATTGCFLSLSNEGGDIFSAYSLTVSNDILIHKHKINASGFYLWKPISSDLRETNLGLLVKYRTRHFGYIIGLNSRIYSFSRSAIIRYNFPDSIRTKFWEPVNAMYRLSYYQQFNPKLNFEASITNYDRYFIQQETNPMILTNLTYIFNSNLQFYSELGYMQAGLLNMHVNYFGLYFRGGVIWRLD